MPNPKQQDHKLSTKDRLLTDRYSRVFVEVLNAWVSFAITPNFCSNSINMILPEEIFL